MSSNPTIKVVMPPAAEAPTVNVPALIDTTKADNRRDIALWMLFGGALAMTAYAFIALWNSNQEHLLYLGLAAHLNIFIILSAIGGLLVKRHIEINRKGLLVHDRDQSSGRDDRSNSGEFTESVS